MSCWKISSALDRTQAEALAATEISLGDTDAPPALVVSEPSAAQPDIWRIDVYSEQRPSRRLLGAVAELVGVPHDALAVEQLADEDWVARGQQGLAPIEAGRFFVHTAADSDRVPEGRVGIRIEASRAFGTGHHATTAGCLAVIDELDARPDSILDLGAGSGLLALAALHRWTHARVTASDIDPVAVEIVRENLAANGVAEGQQAGEIMPILADGLDDPELASRAPYDLILANILAGPLIAMAADIAGALAPGGTLVLAGLLDEQAAPVAAAYADAGLSMVRQRPNAGWPILEITRAF